MRKPKAAIYHSSYSSAFLPIYIFKERKRGRCMKDFYLLRMNGTRYVHYTPSNKWRQLPFHEYRLGDNFLKTSHIFFKENKLRIYALLKQIQCARSLVWVHKSRMPLHTSRVKKIVRLENWQLQQSCLPSPESSVDTTRGMFSERSDVSGRSCCCHASKMEAHYCKVQCCRL